MEYEMTNDITLPGRKPYKLAGQLNRNPRDFRLGAQIGKNYAVAFTSQYKPKSLISISSDLKIATRHITVNIEGQKNHPKYAGKFNCKWDKDASKKVTLEGEVNYRTPMDMSAKFITENPLKNIQMNYNHKVEKITQSHFDLFVAGKQQIVVDVGLDNKDSVKSGSLRLKTPLKDFGLVQLNYDLSSNSKEYSNNMDFSWGKSTKIAVLVNVDKPISINKFHGTVMVKTPFKGYKSSSMEIDHDSTDKVKSMLKTEWNKDKMQVDLEYTNKGKEDESDVAAVISVKSSIPDLRTASFNINHKSSGDRKYQNAMVLEYNGNTYRYEGQVDHRPNAKGLKNSGKLVLYVPTMRYVSDWDYSRINDEIDAVVHSKLNDKVYKVELNGRQAMSLRQGGMSLTLKIKSPMWNDLQVILNHQHRPSLIDSTFTVSNNGNILTSILVNYNREDGKISAKQSFNMADTSLEMVSTMDYQRFPMATHVNMKYNDEEIDITGTYDRRQNSQNGKLKIKSPFSKNIILSVDQVNDGELTTSASIQYGKKEVIAVENRFRWDNTKMVKTSMVLPLETVRKLEYSLLVTGGISTFKAMTSIEAKPLMNKMQLSSEWNSVNGLNGKIRLETPFEQVPYSQITLVSKPSSRLTSSELNIEYLPTQNINLKTSHKVQSNRIQGSFELSTPFRGMRTTSGSLDHSTTKTGFKSLVKYTCPKGTRYSADASYQHGVRKEGSINIKWDQNKIHVSATADMTSGYPAGFLKLSTPFSKDIVVDFKQNKVDAILVTSGFIKYSSGKEISIENRFRFDDAFVFTTSIATPFDSLKKINSVIEAKGNMKSFSFLSSVDVEPATKKLLISGALNTYGGIDGNLRIETPFKAMPYSQMTISSKQTGDSTKTIANIEYLPSKYITVKFNHVLHLEDLDATLEVQTPFKIVRHASASLKLKHNDNGISSHAGFEYPKGKVYSIDSSFKNDAKKEGSVTVVSPYNKPISMSFRHQGKYPSLETHGELQYQGNKKHIVDFTFNNKANFKTSMSYKSPYSDKKSLEVGHKGNKKQLTSYIKAQFKKGQTHQMDFVFKNLAKMQGSLTMKSPLIDDLKASFHHVGSFKNLKSHFEYTYGKMKPASADVALITGKRVQGSVKLSSPFFNDVTLTVKHKGKFTSFRNKVNIIYSKKQKISTDFNFRLAKVMKATFIFVSPFKGYKKVVTNIKHEGTWKNFKCDGIIKRGKEIIKANMKNSIGSKFNWQASIETPIVGWKRVNAAVSHEGKLTNFKCHAEIARGKQDMLSGDIKFAIKPTIDIMVAAQTPVSGYKNVKASVSHQTTDAKIKSHAEITYFKKDTISADFLINKPTKSADIVITTPFKGYEKLSGSFSHTGSLSDFKTKLNLATSKSNKITAEAKFKSEGGMSAEIKIKTPFTDYQTIDLSITHSGSFNNFHSRANVMFNKKKSFADITFNSLSGVEGQFVLQSPYTDTLKANILYKNEGKMKSTVTISYGKKTILDANLLFKHKGTIFGTMSVKALGAPKMEVSIEHEGTMFNNKARLQVSYGKKVIVVDAQMDSKSDVSGKVMISTPFKSARSMYALYSKTGPMKNMNIHFETGIDQQKITVDTTHSADDIMKSSLSIRTPFASFREADMSTRYSGVLTNFDSHGEVTINGKMAEADLTVITNDRIDIRGSMRTPYTEDINFEVNHDGTKNNFKSSSEISYGYKKVSGQVITDFTNGIQLDAAIQTPFTDDIVFATSTNNDFGNLRSLSQLSYKGAKQHELEVTLSVLQESNYVKSSAQAVYNGKAVSGKFDFDGDITNFKSKLHTRYNNKKVIAELQFDSSKNLEGRFSLKTPVTSDFLISFSHEGSMTVFRSKAKLEYGKQSHEIDISFSHAGSFMKFSTNGEISYNGRVVSTDITFDATKDIEGKITLRTPISDDMIVHFSNEGSYTNFKTCLKITYSGSLQHDTSLKFDYAGSIMKFVTKGSLSYNGKEVSTDITFDATKDIEGKITLRTPISDDMIVHFSNKGSYTNFKTCLKITYSGSLQHDASLKVDYSGSMMKFSTKGSFSYNGKDLLTDITFDATKDIEGKASLKTPMTEDIIVAFSHEGQSKHFKTCLKITYSGSLQHDASISFKRSGSIKKFKTKINAMYNGKECSSEVKFNMKSGISADIILQTPWMDDITVSFLHQGQPLSFTSKLELGYSGSIKHNIQLVFNFNMQGNNIQTLIEGRYNDQTVSSVLSADMSSGFDGNVIVKTPWTDDMVVTVKYNGEPTDFNAQLQIDYSGSRQHEILARHNTFGDFKKFSTSASASYNGKEISLDGSYDSTDNNAAQMTLKSPFTKDINARLSLDGTPKRLSSNVDLTYGDMMHKMTAKYDIIKRNSKYGIKIDMSCNKERITTEAMLDLKDDYQMKFGLISPFTDDIEMTSTFQVTSDVLRSSTEIKVAGSIVHDSSISITRRISQNQYSIIINTEYNSKNINSEMSLTTYNGVDAKMTIETPFAGFEQISANFLYEMNRKTGTVQFNSKIGSESVELNVILDKVSPFSAKINLKTPIDGYTDMAFNINFNNNPTNFRLSSDLSTENRNMFDLAIEHEMSSSVIHGNIEMKTAIMEDINMKYDFSGSWKKSSSSISASIGSDNYFTSNTVTSITERRSAEIRSTLDVNIAGITKNAEVGLMAKRSFNDFNIKLNGKVDNDEIALETSYKSHPSYEIMMKIETPFECARSLSAVLTHTGKANYMTTSAALSLSPENSYEMNINLLNKNFKKLDIKAELKTPIKGHELMRWIYKHQVDKTFALFTDYTCSTGIQIIGEIKVSAKSFNVDIKTPYQQFKALSLRGKLEKQNMIYDLDTVLKLNKKAVKLSVLVDLQSSPMTTRIQLKTPFQGLESSEISMSCTGDITDLRASLDVVTPLMKPINSEVHLRYISPIDMEGTAILATGIENFEHLRLSLVNQKQGNEYQTHLETAWKKDAMISVDVSCDVSDMFNGKQMKYSLTVRTPFKVLRTMTLNVGNKYSTDSYMQSVFVEHNGNRLLDIDTSYSNTDKHTVSIVTRHPRPMNFRIGGHKDSSKMNTDISFNWDTNTADSNVNVEAYYGHSENKCNLLLKFVHPSKTAEVRGELERSNNHDLVSFDLSINDENVFGYNYDCKHSADNRDSSMKVRLPSRSIMVTNQVQNRLGSKMVVGSFYWDADRDETKKISMKGDITPSSNGLDANIVLEMPSIGQVRL